MEYPKLKVLDLNQLVEDLELFKALIEWDHPITYQTEIDKVIEIIKEVGKE